MIWLKLGVAAGFRLPWSNSRSGRSKYFESAWVACSIVLPAAFQFRFLNITVSLTFSMRLTTSLAGPIHVCVVQVDHQENLPFAASLKSSFGQMRCQEAYLPAALHMSAASRSPSGFFRRLHVHFFEVSSTWKMAFVTFMVNVTCLRFNAKWSTYLSVECPGDCAKKWSENFLRAPRL